MKDDIVYQNWIESRSHAEPQDHFSAKVMAQIKGDEATVKKETVFAEMVDRIVLENWFVRAGLAVGISLLGLFRLAYVPYHLLVP